MTRLTFPPGFVFGAATSAFQIEGAPAADGRGESIWDRFCATPGAIADGTDGRVACDHYHRWPEDLALMRELGLQSYRFSISWPRVFPDGAGPVNARGLDFYDRLVDALLANGIEPFVTLYHWDLPQALEERGGWAWRGVVDRFVDLADAVAGRLGDRVTRWATHNEPWCVSHLGYEIGAQAPGRKDPAAALAVAHHVLLSHGRAVPVIRARAPGAQVGIVLNLVPAYPASPSAADAEATRAFDGFFNRWYLDPLFRARYPEDAVADRVRQGHLPGPVLPFVAEGDLEAISAPIDFLGVNYYNRGVIRSSAVPEAENLPRTLPLPRPEELTDMGWEDVPHALEDLLARLYREYRPRALVIAENGCAYADGPDAAGRVADARRVEFLRGHLAACARAAAAGVPLRAFYYWSLLDNFEWAHGYTKRFGLIHVDYATQQRTPKDSARFYREVIAARAVNEASSEEKRP
ncbi:MAG: GH1 family beta-glucosidase [Anaeromyxobacter sp.]